MTPEQREALLAAHRAIEALNASEEDAAATWERRVAHFDTLPRFPLSFGALLAATLGRFARVDAAQELPRQGTSAILGRALQLYRLTGADTGIAALAESASLITEQTPRLAFVIALARAAHAARRGGYANAVDALRRAETHARALEGDGGGERDGDGDGATARAVELAAARLDVELRCARWAGVLKAADALEVALEGADDTWDGERFAAVSARALVHLQRDEPVSADREMSRSWELAKERGALLDAGGVMNGWVPVILHRGQAARADALLTEALELMVEGEAPGHLEMPLRQLHMRALEALPDLPRAIKAGFVAIERCASVGDLGQWTRLMIAIAALYQQAGSDVDALHMLRTARRGLQGKPRARELVTTVEEATQAFEADVGAEGLRAVEAQLAARRG